MAVRRAVKPLPKRHQPKEPTPPFSEGDVIQTRYRPLLYSISKPIKVLACQQSKLCVSGWGVTVKTSKGEVMIDSQHFYT